MKGKGRRRDIAKLNTDYLVEGRSESEFKRGRIFQARPFLAVAGTIVTINYEN